MKVLPIQPLQGVAYNCFKVSPTTASRRGLESEAGNQRESSEQVAQQWALVVHEHVPH